MEKLSPFYSALSHLKTFFDIVIDDNEFEEIGMLAWDKIGNKYSSTYHYVGCPDHNGRMKLPCNADIIELVTSGSEEYQRTDNVQRDNFSRLEVENYIEAYKTQNKEYYARGGMIPYTRDGDYLIFNKNVRGARVVYKGITLDENGLPQLNFKEVEAIAIYCAWVVTFKKGMATHNQASVQLAQMLEQRWARACDAARTPVYLNQNDINNIMDVMSSWDRKRYGVSYKLYQ